MYHRRRERAGRSTRDPAADRRPASVEAARGAVAQRSSGRRALRAGRRAAEPGLVPPGALRRAGIVSARRSSADGRDVYYRADLLRCRDLLGAAGGCPPSRASPRAAATGHDRLGGPAARVLFLCTGNSARSQIAEALVEHRSEQTIAARSAGSRPKPLHPNAVQVMAERGIDIADRPTKYLRGFARSRFDRVDHAVRQGARDLPRVPRRPRAAHWSIADPAAEGDTDDATFPRSSGSPTRSRCASRCCSPS